MRIHEIKSPYIRMPSYLAAMPIAVFALFFMFLLCGLCKAAKGFTIGLRDGFCDGNNLTKKKFWIGCWDGFMGN